MSKAAAWTVQLSLNQEQLMARTRSNSSELLARSEWREQVAIFQWAEIAKAQYPELEYLIGSLNGVRLSTGSAVKAKRAGLKAGYPDLCLDVARRPYHGLRIELKAMYGKLDPEQMRWLQHLNDQGYRAVACWGADQAIHEIKSYLEGLYR